MTQPKPTFDLNTLLPAFTLPPRLALSSWWGHVPFAAWLVAHLRPACLVELGTHTGVSYTAFCEAALVNEQDGKFFAVDTWAGDDHAGFYGDDIYNDLAAFHRRYESFSTLIRATFEESVEHFADGSIDLLHIDGYHTYEAVRGDFEMWQPKLSDRAIVLFHDTQVRQGSFGVWRYWDEVRAEYPHFEFFHASGLGVLFVGTERPHPVADFLLSDDSEQLANIRRTFAFLGERWIADILRDYNQNALDKTQGLLAHQKAEAERLGAENADLNGQVQHWHEQAAHFERYTDHLKGEKTQLEDMLAALEGQRDHLLAEAETQQGYYRQLENAYLPLKAAYETLEKAQRQLWETHQALSAQHAQLQAELTDATARYERLQAELADAAARYERLQAEYTALRGHTDRLEAGIQGMRGSLSWRITAPLRAVKRRGGQ